jgi:hypothetical protein
MVIVREGTTKHTTAINQSSSTFNYALIQANGNDRLVVIGINFEEDTVNTRYVTSVTFDGISMTQLANISPISWPDTGLKQYVDFYYMLDSSLSATTGSKEIVVTLDGVVAADVIFSYVVEYSGVKQGVPDDSAAHENGAAGATSVTLTAVATGSVGILVCGSGGTTALDGNENNLTTVQSSVDASSAGGLGELLGQSTGFTFGYNALATREGCIGAVWQPVTIVTQTQTHQMML